MENGILINYMDAERWNGQLVTVIGGNSRMVTRKDMEKGRGLMETDTSGNTWIITCTGMEYSDGLMEGYITENTNRIIKMAKDITGGQMVKNIGESGRMACDGEKESHKRREYYTEKNTKKTSASAVVKYSEILQSLSRNR
jgi:hypothetical protein